MNQEQKRTIRSLLRKVTPQEATKLTKFTIGQIISAQFAWYTVFCGEISLWKTKEDFKKYTETNPLINTMKDLRPIENLASMNSLEINRYYYHGRVFRLGDNLDEIYNDLTNTETI